VMVRTPPFLGVAAAGEAGRGVGEGAAGAAAVRVGVAAGAAEGADGRAGAAGAEAAGGAAGAGAGAAAGAQLDASSIKTMPRLPSATKLLVSCVRRFIVSPSRANARPIC